mmetsp:Transcript_22001/g.45600  ORF Transcript_22001/g.45600 Transcript_22001/m.45600 type:complete len:264 (-) Transcript_22001:46-837(-)
MMATPPSAAVAAAVNVRQTGQRRARRLLVAIASAAAAAVLARGLLSSAVPCGFSVSAALGHSATAAPHTTSYGTRSSPTALAAYGPVVMEPPAPPMVAESEGTPDAGFAECQISAAYRRGQPCGSGKCSSGGVEHVWTVDSEAWVFRKSYAEDFTVVMRKMGYHLPMIFQNVSVACEEMSLRDLARKTCVDCIRHLTSDAYGEMGMLVPAHPDEKLRGRKDAAPVEALNCLLQGKAFAESAPGAGLFCRSRERAGSPGGMRES